MTVLLQAEDVSVVRGAAELLADVSLELRAGELTALLGANGAGKSTLLRVLLGEIAPQTGSVRLLGQELTTYRAEDRARLCTLVPQEQPLDFPLRVRELVELGRLPHAARGSSREVDRLAVSNALEKTNLLPLSERELASLSGGERQRASLARALAQATPVLLLDEPTAHLDVAHQIELLEICRRRSGDGAAILVALHDLALAARFADRVLVLDQGQLCADGKPHAVLTAELLSRSFGVDTHIERDDSGRIAHLSVVGRSC